MFPHHFIYRCCSINKILHALEIISKFSEIWGKMMKAANLSFDIPCVSLFWGHIWSQDLIFVINSETTSGFRGSSRLEGSNLGQSL